MTIINDYKSMSVEEVVKRTVIGCMITEATLKDVIAYAGHLANSGYKPLVLMKLGEQVLRDASRLMSHEEKNDG